MTSKSKALTTAAAAAPAHGVDSLSRSESLAVEVAESYDPAVDANWTALGGIPTNQDAALNTLAANAAASANVGLSWAQATYDFSIHGGAISVIGLDVEIPDSATILYATTRFDVATASGAAGTIKFLLPTDGDLTAAYATGTVGQEDAIPTWAAANSVLTTAAREISVQIETGTLTAGKATLYVAYVV